MSPVEKRKPTIQIGTRRAVPEWIGSSPDAKVPMKVRLRIFEANAGRCGLTGKKIGPGDAWDLDHKVPLRNGGAHRETNLWPVLKQAHREKTARENRDGAKADRIRLKHTGGWPKSRTPLRSRNTFKDRRPSHG